MTATEILIEGGHSLVVVSGDIVATFDGRGVSDLHHIFTTSPTLLNGATVADKVIGAGAAALMVAGKVTRVHTLVISAKALMTLFGGGVAVTYDRMVPCIINRAGTGPCPLESQLRHCTTAAEMLPIIHRFVSNLPQ